jgi:glyoxylase-like metal-dependent hydrolase (beta-lactamase superfamily II)
VSSGLTITGQVQREAWAARTMPPAEQLADDLWSIPVEIPNSTLRYTSVYVLAGDEGLTLIDSGWNSDAAWAGLTGALTGLGASIEDVRGCLVTHQHYDHLGLSGRIRAASGAWVALHPADHARGDRHDLRNPARAAEALYEWLTHVGAPEAEAQRLRRTFTDLEVTDYPEPDRLIEDGELLTVPGWQLRVVHTPGHTPGHVSFLAEERGLYFSGDHVLPRISPHVPSDIDPGVDALSDYLDSLDKVADLPAREVLPAHEWRFAGLAERVDELSAHHERRLGELLAVIARRPGLTPWELAAELTWSRSWDQYDGLMRVSAVDETKAHVARLHRLGRVIATDEPAPRYFVAAAQPAADPA